ncbi:MAG TPA: NADH-quinone oxidoreductase subunit C [Micromonosporaceae bacterium]|jgi:Ni,Fe-hydrogenase III large subunit/Ni,Fe-hydrogenase III component G
MTRSTTREVWSPETLRGMAGRLFGDGYRLASVAGHHDDEVGQIRIVYLFTAGAPDRRTELVWRTPAAAPSVPSLAALSFPASRFERELRDLFAVEPHGHPMLAPMVHHPHWPHGWHPLRHDAGPRPALGSAQPHPFHTVEGDGVYEIPVGPVHAGLVEPGHFRFSVVGETILRLKARLWYVHRGIEGLAEGHTVEENVALAERVSGDTTVGHALAYSMAVEDALDIEVSSDVARCRALLLELERLHNHVADIGMICNDVAYGIAHAHAQRIRERLLRLNKVVTGHRLLRGGVFPAGVHLLSAVDVSQVASAARDLAELVRIALRHSVVRERLTDTAVLKPEQARGLGTLGYVARASGLEFDARVAHPFCDLGEIPVATRSSGDVLARFEVRAEEAGTSDALVREIAPTLQPGRYGTAVLATGEGTRSGVGIVEGWRGAIVHRVEIGAEGLLSRWKIVDPSFFNWPALPVAMADTIVPDFPLANKSFNLSYAGNDL